MLRLKRILALSSAIAVTLATHGLAQDNIDQIEDRFGVERKPLSQAGRVIPAFDPLEAPAAAGAFVFRLGAVKISGNSVLNDAEISSAYRNLLGQEISVVQLFAIANEITTIYGKRGYPLSRAIVPAQEIGADGSVRIQIVEGFVDKVLVEGPGSENATVLKHGEALKREVPISNKTLERHLLLADDLPGVSVRSVLRRSDDSLGGTDVVLQTEAEDPFAFSITADNRGSDAVGPLQLDTRFTFQNLVGVNSESSFRFVTASLSKELLYLTADHRMVVSDEGTELSFGLKRSQSEPGTQIFTDIELETSATTALIRVSHPVIRSRAMNLELDASFEARNTETLSLGVPLSADRIRSLRFGLEFDNTDDNGGLNTASLEVSKGLSGFGANSNGDPLNSREFGTVDYTKAVLELSRTQELGAFSPSMAAWSVHGKVMTQLTNNPLLSSEECGLGGTDFGRAFDSSTLSGDRCAAASVEVRYKMTQTGPLDGLQLYGFYDVGRVSNIDPDASTGSASLASGGLGARFSFLDRYSGSLEFAKPIRNTGSGSDDNSSQVFFSISGEF